MNNKTSPRTLSLKEKVVLYLNLDGLFIVLYRLTAGRIAGKVNVLILTMRERTIGKTRTILLHGLHCCYPFEGGGKL